MSYTDTVTVSYNDPLGDSARLVYRDVIHDVNTCSDGTFTLAGMPSTIMLPGGGTTTSFAVSLTRNLPTCVYNLRIAYTTRIPNDGITYFVANGSAPATPVPGCTNPAALNYNPAATVDDGSCILPVLGCTNAGATNYNPSANVDNGSCTFAAVPGCTNPRAINYNPSATSDNGSCILPVPGCTIAGSLNYNPAANVNDGSCVPITRGCTVPGATNYSASANRDDGSCVYPAAPGIPAASIAACCNWTDGDVVPQAAWRSMDNCGNNTFIVITSPSATIAAQAAQIAALQAQVLALAHIDEGILP